MKRWQRRWHRWAWSLIAPVLACLLLAAWWDRAPPPPAAELAPAWHNAPVEGRR